MDEKYQSNSTLIIRNEKGQLSIFLGLALILVVSFLAFVINVGLFVKAKINLQNAVDSAAWSGAATQARQLTNISYLNWEMRNTYKEWMFKYYVLGQLGLTKTRKGNIGNGNMDFRLKPFSYSNPDTFDPYNMPSVCIHFGSPNNICEIYNIPGLPRYETANLSGVQEVHEATLNSFVKTKSKDCAERSKLNFTTALLWTYGTSDPTYKGNTQIATDRTGAWPQSIELAIRMRNLEMFLNRPPVSDPICLGGQGCIDVSSLDAASPGSPFNERPIKAFWSAYRNLGGGVFKETGGNPEDVKFHSSFKLTEIPPTAFNVTQNSLSSFFIPLGEYPGTGVSTSLKHYVDLKAYPLNLSIMYSHMLAATEDPNQKIDVVSEGACRVTKTAIPVPGYILGFVKNPEVLTYYAVKGEANYIGLFYPFADRNGVKLTAYAAAKPFGGRVGPQLFDVHSDEKLVKPRTDGANRSASYVSGLNTDFLRATSGSTGFRPGFPLPIDSNFWVREQSSIGGVPNASGQGLSFGIPNLLYDLTGDLNGQVTGTPISVLNTYFSANTSPKGEEKFGLYDTENFKRFIDNLPNGYDSRTVLNAREINETLARVRRPTLYDAVNYLVPRFEADPKRNPNNLETPPFIRPFDSGTNGKVRNYAIYAPLFGENTLYNNSDAIVNEVQSYLETNRQAIKTFSDALQTASQGLLTEGAKTKGGDSYVEAANTIWTSDYESNCQSGSIAAEFYQFILGRREDCGIKPLKESMREHFSRNTGNGGDQFPFRTFYHAIFFTDPLIENTSLLTAYSPGQRQGATFEGESIHPFDASANALTRRNSYSTKYIPLSSLIRGSANNFLRVPPYQETAPLKVNTGVFQGGLSFKNPINSNTAQEVNAIKH